MLNIWRNKMPDIENAGSEAANRVMKAANNAAQSAKDASGHLEEWAQEGLESMKTRPLMWGAASLGFGALMGGLYALFQKAKPKRRVAARSVPARAHAKQTLRASAEPAGTKKRAKKTRRTPSAADA
ncbi:MAG TPA: hypothetical protein VNH44_12190 [Micropepsaceae bacterium]|nr:hypothetical protein [Micropepsaceae bacterium]